MSQYDTAPATTSGAAAELFAGAGEMRARCRALDWAATPLGPVETWPAALRWTVRTAMDSPFPINLWCGPELVLIYNDGYRHVLGDKHPGSLGRRGTEVWHEIWPEISPMFDQIRGGGPPVYADDAPFVIERAGNAGSAAPGQPNAWFTFALSPVRDDEGEIVAFLNVVSETTRRLMAERRLEAERGRLAEIFERAPAFIATLRGPDHVFESTNPLYRQLIGHRDVVGRPVRLALPEVVEQGFIGLLDGVYRTGEPFVGTEVNILLQSVPGAAPVEHVLNFLYQPIREPDGTISGIFVHAVDVSEQVRARREVEQKAEELTRLARALEASNRELDQFAYVTSHDLKAPLRGIANLSQWIEDDLADRFTAESHEHMRLLRGRVHRMEALIDGILQYSRAGRTHQAPERVDTGQLAEEVADLIAPPEGVRIGVDAGMPVLCTERLPLQQVLLNLVSNAVKYGGPGVRVEVSAQGAGEGGHHFTVRDDGPGIAPEYHERIFAIFQTLAARDKVEGTGIGLSIVKKMVESRGGRVWVESEPGRGAAFHFLWPAQPAEAVRG
ncbi:MAG TPA: ATP-binding protein [Longimicrobium sp.]|nr:ATP-binding protein [Longimicrobium sp.]